MWDREGERKGKKEDFVGWWVGGLRCSYYTRILGYLQSFRNRLEKSSDLDVFIRRLFLRCATFTSSFSYFSCTYFYAWFRWRTIVPPRADGSTTVFG